MKKDSLLSGIGAQGVSKIVQFRVKEGSDLLLAIREAVDQTGIKTGVIMSGIGALNKAVFRNLKVFPKSFPIQEADRIYMNMNAPMELVSLGGWIAADEEGKTKIHAHFSASTVSDETVVTLGGHLTEGTIAGVLLVVAVAVLEGDNAFAKVDEGIRSIDLFFSDYMS